MLIPIRTDYRMTRRPWVNYAIILANVVVYLLGYNGTATAKAISDLGLLQPDPPQLYQFFTCMFMHGGWQHLMGNMVFLWVFGNAINDVFGHLGYLLFYLAGGVLAGVGYLLLGGSAPVLGASGAISAVTGAYLVLLPRTRVTLLAILVWVILPFEISSLYFIGLQFVWNLVMSVGNFVTPTGTGGVAYAAHSTGYAFGALVAMAMLAWRIVPTDRFDMFNLWRSYRKRVAYRRMVAEGYDPFSYTGRPAQPQANGQPWTNNRGPEAVPADPQTAQEFELRRGISQAIQEHDLGGASQRYLELASLSPEMVLSREQQLQIAHKLNQDGMFAQAADAYERYLRHFQDEHTPDVLLLLGILYGYYLGRPDQARERLQKALERLRDPRKIQKANEVLASLGTE